MTMGGIATLLAYLKWALLLAVLAAPLLLAPLFQAQFLRATTLPHAKQAAPVK
jgi:hypothetical protein